MLISRTEEPEHSHGTTCCACDTGHDHGHSHASISAFAALIGGVLVLNSYLGRFFFSEVIDPYAVELSALVGAVILSVPIFWAAIKDLAAGKVYMNELVALALLAALAGADYRVAGTIAFFMLITITIERKTAIGAESSIESLIRLTPRRARRLREGVEQDVDVSELAVGDVVRVRPGENFPADGEVDRGSGTVNQASITGESLPVDKTVGDGVFAGTQNLTGALDIRVTSLGSDTTLGKVRELISAAEQSRLPFMRLIDRYAAYYTPSILMIASLVWFVTGDMNRVIAVLVVACPCALVVATPSALIAALASAARLGILIKDVSHMELASRIKAVVFDKTGTLTEGNLEVARLNPAEGVELADLLEVATSAECHSNHPAAQALRRLAEEAGVEWEDPAHYEEQSGRGVVAQFGDSTYRVGRASWLKEIGLDTAPMEASLDAEETVGMSIVFVARDHQILGWIGLRDAVRPVAAQAVEDLQALGVSRCCMVTGDNQSVAEAVGGRIGIAELRAGCLPHEKVDYVENLRERGYVVGVVGDGVNDAPALAAGDIGIAMGAIGSDVAIHSASVALMNNDLRRVPFLIRLSRSSRAVMNQNLFVGLMFILAGVYFSTVGVLTPILAAIVHNLGTLFIIFNSARLVRQGEELQTAEAEGRVAVPMTAAHEPEDVSYHG